MKRFLLPAIAVFLPALAGVTLLGQQKEAPKAAAAAAKPPLTPPPLFFREDWRQVPNDTEHPVTQQSVGNPHLLLGVYGPGGKQMQTVKHAPPDETIHIWTGLCEANCGLTLRDKDNYVDLSGLGKIRWRVWEYGFRRLYPIVKLADGTWLVGDHSDAYTTDYYDSDFLLTDVRWRLLDIAQMAEKDGKNWVEHPDLSRVDEIGFTDLRPGTGHGTGSSSHVQWLEVYGRPVPRNAPQTSGK
jgi:hypothetical protein